MGKSTYSIMTYPSCYKSQLLSFSDAKRTKWYDTFKCPVSVEKNAASAKQSLSALGKIQSVEKA